MNQSLTMNLLSDMFGATSDPYKKAKLMSEAGLKLTAGLFTVSVSYGDQVLAINLPSVAPKFMTLDDDAKGIMRAKVADLIEQSFQKLYPLAVAKADPWQAAGPMPIMDATATAEEVLVPVSKPAPTWAKVAPTAKEMKVASEHVPSAPAAEEPVPKKAIKPKASPTPIKLADARVVGQKVTGTSAGSIYRAAAIGNLNVAVRVQNNVSVSVRAEFQHARNEQTVKNLVSMGFSDNGKYLSMHLHLTPGVPTMRVVGSVLFGTGLEFDQVATTEGAING